MNKMLIERRQMTTATRHHAGLGEPATLPALLRLLGVNHEPAARQWDAIMGWLDEHPASSELWVSLLANGYGLMLKQGVPAGHHPTPSAKHEQN
jgi:hypothetical protein